MNTLTRSGFHLCRQSSNRTHRYKAKSRGYKATASIQALRSRDLLSIKATDDGWKTHCATVVYDGYSYRGWLVENIMYLIGLAAEQAAGPVHQSFHIVPVRMNTHPFPKGSIVIRRFIHSNQQQVPVQ